MRQTENYFEDPFIEPEQQGLDILDEAGPEDFDAEPLTFAPRSLGGVPKYEPKKLFNLLCEKLLCNRRRPKKRRNQAYNLMSRELNMNCPPKPSGKSGCDRTALLV